MKKFLGKKPVMITFLALAVVMLVVYIGMLVRPVAIGMTYKGEVTMYGQKAEISVKVTSGKKLEMTTKVDGDSMTEKGYYFEKDGYIVFMDADNDEEYKAEKKELLNNWEDTKAMIKATGMGGIDCNAFGVEVMGEDFTCVGSIVFAVVGGIVTAAVITFATLSTIVVLKKKKA